ncbi:MAG: septal ring lytic transglycosylase RlpA family protein [Massilia sp.]|nr:septal ring lytic transglycosylase RlpA family protein [Massilia sp.]
MLTPRLRLLPAAWLPVWLLASLLAGCAVAPIPGAPARPPTASHASSHPKTADALPVLPAAGSGRGGYYQDDGPGEHPPANLRALPDAAFKAEPLLRAANKPYAVFGTTYTPIAGNAPFSQRGMATWYGKKFHGQRTSSGEPYDMYKMTAAHPTLPIPSYARITSLSSGEQVVVRINDRGPFRSSRIVDVSYTAALKLGLLGKGSHEVTLERVLAADPAPIAATRSPGSPAQIAALMLDDQAMRDDDSKSDADAAQLPSASPVLAHARADGYYLQLGAFSRADKAAEMRERVLASGAVALIEVEAVRGGALHRLYGGPFASRDAALQAARAMPAALAIKPIVLRRSAD